MAYAWTRGKRAKRSIAWAMWLSVLALVSGCVHLSDTTPLQGERGAHLIYGPHTVGQTIVCHHAGLDGISVLMQAQEGSGPIVLHLRESVDSTLDVVAASVSPQPDVEPTLVHFALPVQQDTNGRSFYLLIESPNTPPGEAVHVPYGMVGTAEQGLTVDDMPAEGRLSFKLHYSVPRIVQDVARQAARHGVRALWLLFLSALLCLLPGGAAVVWLVEDGSWVERTVLATGLGVALQALLVYATLTGLRLGPGAVIGVLALCGALIVARWGVAWRRGERTRILLQRAWRSAKGDLSPWALLAVLGSTVAVRLFVVRDLVAPMWGDSYHHTMIAQLMIDNGGLFDSWQPYAPLTTFTYHFGFHANVALFHWLSGEPAIDAVIWVGQVLNALAALALYPLALKASNGRRWAGVGAVLVAGLLSPMPMYYVNWGRYTQLAGQVILPLAMWLTWRVLEKPALDGKQISLTSILVAGLGITHYRVVLIYAVFAIAWVAVFVVRRWGRWPQVGRVMLRLLLIGGLALLLFLPWGKRVLEAKIAQIGLYLIEQGNDSDFHRGEYNAIGDVSFYVPVGLLISSALALSWGAWRRRPAVGVMALWVAGLLILANPYLVGLPGTGIVNNFAVFIALYIPAAVLTGGLLAEVGDLLWRWRRWSSVAALTVALVVASGWGLYQRLRDLRPSFALVTEADLEAMAWIRERTPPDATFLVNGVFMGPGLPIAGADAGWWIPLLTGRRNTVPPSNYMTEVAVEPDYWRRVEDALLYVERFPPTVPQGARFLSESGVTHIYVGQRGGRVGNPGDPLLDPAALSADPAYRVVYERDGVWIFELLPLQGRSGSS